VAVVTGANHGIGAAVARALAASGCAVLLTYLRLHPDDPGLPQAYRDQRARAADEVVSDIRAAGGRAAALETDLSQPEAARAVFDAAETSLGPVDVLVNNASSWLADTFLPDERDRYGRALRPVDAGSHRQQFAVDAEAPALLMAEFARRHVARGGRWGRIIGLTSGGDQGFPEEVSYGAAKAAQTNYTMSAAAELARYGVTANMVYPPVTDTGWITDEVREFVRTSRDHHHVATPEQVADVIVFLCSDAGALVTGNVLVLR